MSEKEQKPQVDEVVTAPKTEKAPKVVEEKLVEVTPKISGNKFIAGTWYDFTKDKEIKVPQEVKRILKEANAIYI